MKWELDFWYELWDRAGSQGLDTWYDPRDAGGRDASHPPPDTAEAADDEPEGARDPSGNDKP